MIPRSFLVGLLLLSAGAGLAEVAPLPGSLTIAGKMYTVVPAKSAPDMSSSKPPKAFRFQVKDPVGILDETFRYWLGGATFLRTPDGRVALPYHGGAPFVGYIDLAKKSFVPYQDAFPPTGEKPYEGGPTRYGWVALLDEGPQPQGLCLFVSRWNREAQRWASWRARIRFDATDQIEVTEMKGVAVLEVLARNEKEFIACIDDGPDRTWARISTDTWKVLAKGKPAKEYGHLGRTTYSPDKSEIYTVYSSGGLVIFNAADGVEKAHLDAGRYANASTFGATFDPSGSVAVVSTPYASEVTLIDVKTRQIIARHKTSAPLAGIIFNAKDSTANAVGTFLPYE
jgi:hypothetical protein